MSTSLLYHAFGVRGYHLLSRPQPPQNRRWDRTGGTPHPSGRAANACEPKRHGRS